MSAPPLRLPESAEPKRQQARLTPEDVGLTDFEHARARTRLGREPSVVELGMLGALWSEHCAYKHSRPLLDLLPTTGARVVAGPGENAGAVDLGGGLAAVFKVESHNHPSAVEPFQGAATGVGGIVRDVFAMGARPAALLNALFFGDPARPRTRALFGGVVGGISFYGNCLGIPDVGGHVSFDPSYDENPLVNAMCVGIVETARLVRATGARPGEAVYLIGADTGRDGIAGASLLASFELGDADQEKRPSVQVGDPFLEKLLLEACLELVQGDHVSAMQDLGAAGLSCAVSEVAAKAGVGIEVDVRAVPRRAGGMTPYEVMLSESQERMLVVPKRGREADLERIAGRWGLHCTRVGVVVPEDVVRVRDGAEVVADAPATLFVEGAPTYDLTGDGFEPAPAVEAKHRGEPRDVLLELLASPEVASRERVYRRYDQMVGIDTVLGPGGDAAVLRLRGRRDGLALAIDANPRLAARDPYLGALASVAEAARNLVCVGARPLALTDCLNLGNPERPRGAWQLRRTIEGLADAARALGLPFVSGNVSLYNGRVNHPDRPFGAPGGPMSAGGGSEAHDARSEGGGRLRTQPSDDASYGREAPYGDARTSQGSRSDPASAGRDIVPTAVVGAVGQLDDVARAIPPGIGAEGDALVLLGTTGFDLEAEARLHATVLEAHAADLLRAAHDLGQGGFAVGLAEMAIRAACGAVVRLDEDVFADGYGRILITTRDAPLVAAIAERHRVAWRYLGVVEGTDVLIEGVLRVPVAECARAHQGGLARALGLP